MDFLDAHTNSIGYLLIINLKKITITKSESKIYIFHQKLIRRILRMIEDWLNKTSICKENLPLLPKLLEIVSGIKKVIIPSGIKAI